MWQHINTSPISKSHCLLVFLITTGGHGLWLIWKTGIFPPAFWTQPTRTLDKDKWTLQSSPKMFSQRVRPQMTFISHNAPFCLPACLLYSLEFSDLVYGDVSDVDVLFGVVVHADVDPWFGKQFINFINQLWGESYYSSECSRSGGGLIGMTWCVTMVCDRCDSGQRWGGAVKGAGVSHYDKKDLM